MSKDMELQKMDGKTAFLNRDLKENIYDAAKRIQIQGHKDKVYKLKKYLYGF